MPASCRERRPADNGNTAVATISVIRNERCCSLSPQPQGPGQSPPNTRDGGAWHFLSPSPLPLLLPAGCRADASTSRPLDSASASHFSMPIEAPSPLVHWCLSTRLPLVHRLVVTSPVVVCLRLVSPFVAQPPHASIFDPPSLFSTAGCHVANIRTAPASRRAVASLLAVSSSSTSTFVKVVIVVVSRRAIAIVVDFVACRVVAIVDGDAFF